jgi:hypothetical protein
MLFSKHLHFKSVNFVTVEIDSLDRHLIAPHIQPWRTTAKQCGLIRIEFTAYELSTSRAV